MISIPNEADGVKIHAISASTTVFNQEEVECVDELWQEYLSEGPERSGYYFLVEKEADQILGYACYGPRSLTSGTFDLYWIAVDSTVRRGGVGRRLLAACEQAVKNLGGRLLVLETSGMPTYVPTRNFYLSTGYTLEATIKDFYSQGDDLVIFTKHL
jgi:ribosomal protein S18 acetylase RimI-like enzyme